MAPGRSALRADVLVLDLIKALLDFVEQVLWQRGHSICEVFSLRRHAWHCITTLRRSTPPTLTITGPQQDLNLGIQTFVNGSALSVFGRRPRIDLIRCFDDVRSYYFDCFSLLWSRFFKATESKNACACSRLANSLMATRSGGSSLPSFNSVLPPTRDLE
jgi:hypothetical protein